MFLLPVVLAAALLIGFACGDDDDDEEETAAPTTGGATATEAAGELETDFGVSDTEITLGLTIVQSGNLAAVYAPVVPAMQAYFGKVNAEDDGVCGRQIKLIVEDDQYSPTVALDKAKKLVEEDEVVAFTGNLGTPAVTGQVDYINQQEVPHLWVSTGATKWGDADTYPWTTGYIPDYTSEGEILGNYVNENFAGQSVAALYQNDDFGKNGFAGFSGVFEGEIVAEQTYESTATDVSSQLAVLRDANPDILYLYSTPSFTAKVFAYMKANSWDPQVVESYVNSATQLASLVGGGTAPEQIQAGFADIAGTISTNYILDPVADVDEEPIVEHARILSEYGGGSLTTLSVYAQGLAETAVETLRIACENGDMTRAGVMAAAESLDEFAPSVLLPGITISTSPDDHFAIQSLLPIEVQADGTLEALADEPISVE
jgi:branched-chain amino acid transport system substrate-binding protein